MTVVVGVDGSPGALEALRLAVREATLRGVPARAVHVWHVPEGTFLSGFAPSAADVEACEERARTVLAESLAAVEGTEGIEGVLVQAAAPAPALLEAARGAELLVVGSRGWGTMHELLLGSVSHECCRHAHCPVLVVPHELEQPLSGH